MQKSCHVCGCHVLVWPQELPNIFFLGMLSMGARFRGGGGFVGPQRLSVKMLQQGQRW